VSQTLLRLGVTTQPFSLMYTEVGVIIALTHVLVPYVVIAVWTSLQRINPQVESAALSLGAGMSTVIFRIVLPQVMPGILSGGIIVFALAASAFATPQIIGGARLKVASTLAYDEFLNSLNWPLGAAIAVLLCGLIVAVIVLANRFIERRYSEVFQ
jgi:putative spermidine/putrescine transport system permease protein